MKIISIHVLKLGKESPLFLNSVYELGFLYFYERPFYKETLNFGVRTAVNRVSKQQRNIVTIPEAKAQCYIYIDLNNIAIAIVADAEYPDKVVFRIIQEQFQNLYKAFPLKELETIDKDCSIKLVNQEQLIKKYQNPAEADKLTKLENTLNEVQNICIKNMDDLLKRGEQLEEIMSKSKDMSNLSVNFYKNAKKANSRCCLLI